MTTPVRLRPWILVPALVALAAAAVALFLPAVLGIVLARLLPDTEIAHLDLGLGRVEINGLRAAAGRITVDRLLIEYDWRRLWAGRIDSVVAERPRIDIDLDQIDMGGLGGSPDRGAPPLLPEIARLLVVDGHLGFRVAGRSVAIPFAIEGAHDAGAFTADVRLSGDAAGGFAVRLAGNGWQLGSRDVRLSFPGWPAATPEPLREAMSGPLQVAITGAGGGPLEWSFTGQGNEAVARGDLRIEVMGNGGRVSAETSLSQAPAARPRLAWVNLDLVGLALPAATIDARLRLGELDWPFLSGDVRCDINIAAQDLKSKAINAREVVLAAEGVLRLAGEHASLILAGPGRLWSDGLALPGGQFAAGPLTALLAPADQPLVEVSGGRLAARGRLMNLETPVAQQGTPSSPTGRLTADEISFAAAYEFEDGEFAWSVGLDGGRVEIGQPAWSLGGIRARAGSEGSVSIDNAVLRQLTDRPWVKPLRLTGSAVPSADGWTLAAELTDEDRSLRLRLTGRHEERTGRGSARLALAPLDFSPEGVKPAGVFPVLAGHVTNVRGRLAANGRIAWTRQGYSPSIDLLLENISASVGNIGIHRLNTVIRLDGLAPLSTPPDQIMAVGLIEAGLPLTDGEVVFQVTDKGLHIGSGSISLAGGRMAIEKATFAPGSAARQDISFTVSEADLSEIVRLVGLDGLEATGRLAGRIPVAFIGDRIVVDGGHLAATAPGQLRYRPAQRPAALQGGGQPVDLMLKALDNFHYKALTLTVTGEAGGEVDVALHVDGNNPDLYEGYPLEFNLNLGGKLDTILQDTLAGYQIPDKIRQRMLEFSSP